MIKKFHQLFESAIYKEDLEDIEINILQDEGLSIHTTQNYLVSHIADKIVIKDSGRIKDSVDIIGIHNEPEELGYMNAIGFTEDQIQACQEVYQRLSMINDVYIESSKGFHQSIDDIITQNIKINRLWFHTLPAFSVGSFYFDRPLTEIELLFKLTKNELIMYSSGDLSFNRHTTDGQGGITMTRCLKTPHVFIVPGTKLPGISGGLQQFHSGKVIKDIKFDKIESKFKYTITF